MRRIVILLALSLLAMTSRAFAVCTAGEVKTGCGGSCTATCNSSVCVITGTATVTPATPGGTCAFDFGAVDVVLTSGGFVGNSNVYEISARGLTLGGGGTLTATRPGRVSLMLGDGGFTVASGALPLQVGAGLLVQSAGNVLVQGAPIRATGTAAPGGTVSITTTGPPASGVIDLRNTLDVTGGGALETQPGGGIILVHATGDVLLGTPPASAPLLVADGADGATGSSGGSIEIVAGGRVGAGASVGRISASGGSSSQFGGLGGAVSILARNGAVTLNGGVAGGIAVDGGAGATFGGDGGDLEISSDGPLGAAITLDVPLSAKGPHEGEGGVIEVEGPGAITVSQMVDSSGQPASEFGRGGDVALSGRGQVAVTSTGAIRADGGDTGGSIDIEGDQGVILNGTLSAKGLPTLGTGGLGGDVDVVSGGSTDVGSTIDVSGAGIDAEGGLVIIQAGKDIAIAAGAALNADGSGPSSIGGEIQLLAGSQGSIGNLTVTGSVHAKGSYAGMAGSFIELQGCTVHVAGKVDSAGDALAFNTIVARKALLVDAGPTRVSTTGAPHPESKNFVTLPTGAVVPGSGVVPPPTTTFKPLCTAPNQPAGCLTPCTVCGDGILEFPEQCDDGAANATCQPCDSVCHVTNCDDGDSCTTNACAAPMGCDNSPIVGCYHPVSGTVPAGGTVTTDPAGTGPTPAQPLGVSVTMPISGSATINRGVASTPQPGFTVLGTLAQITLVPPDTLASAPFDLTFTLDATVIPPGQDPSTILIQKNGATVNKCTGIGLVAEPDPCVFSRLLDSEGNVRIRVLTSDASDWAALADACGNAPQAGCRTPADHAASTVLSGAAGSTSSSLKWSWARGAATCVQDFGDPLGATDYTLCVYDHGGTDGAWRIRQRAVAPHGGICKQRPCWKQTTKGFKYFDPSATPDGLKQITLVAGEDRRAKIVVTGKGANLAVPSLPLAEPVRVQLRRSGSKVCWDAPFGQSLINDANAYRARSD